jgi:hypothetical protein
MPTGGDLCSVGQPKPNQTGYAITYKPDRVERVMQPYLVAIVVSAEI